MPRRKHAPRNDDFLVWFESLPVELQRKAIQVADRIHEESFGGIISTDLVEDALFHVKSSQDPIIFLN